MNPHVSRILQTQEQLGERPRFIPRQHGPAVQPGTGSAEYSAAAGVSAFAFQGTNAHAVLCRTAGPLAAAGSSNPLWQRRRLWCATLLQLYTAPITAPRYFASLQHSALRPCTAQIQAIGLLC